VEKFYAQPLSMEREEGELQLSFFLFFLMCFSMQLGWRASLPVITKKGRAFFLFFWLSSLFMGATKPIIANKQRAWIPRFFFFF
jgi:hypothetical protein